MATTTGLLHDIRVPGESEEYRAARDELLRAEIELRRHNEAVNEMRRALPPGGELPEDYLLSEWDQSAGRAKEVRFSELFDGTDSLLLYSFMFLPGPTGPLDRPCPVCTSIIDGLDGAVPHIAQRTGFAVVAKAPIEQFGAHGRARGWRNVRLLSSTGSTYNADYNTEGPNEAQRPILNSFVRNGAAIRHFWASEEAHAPAEPGQHPRHVDFMWPMWALFDRTTAGRDSGWMPQLVYGEDDER
jgi:predicted dithiol-disulfide oxidoreductase (DUF899 family)